MAGGWTLLIFGDSWANYLHPCWPEVLSRRLSTQVFNFADAGATVSDLTGQVQRALMHPHVPKAPGGTLNAKTLVVAHCGGNDLIQNMAQGMFAGGVPDIFRPNPGAREAKVLREFVALMYKAGARHFLISGVPAFPEMPIWNIVWPIAQNMARQGKFLDLGVGPSDDARLALDVQIAALYDRWSDLCNELMRCHEGSNIVFFDEVGGLERLRNSLGAASFDRGMWDMTMFHPSLWGHEQIASEAHRCIALNVPELAKLAPHPEVANATPGNTSADSVAASKSAEGKPLTVRVLIPKGNVTFTVACTDNWTVGQLKAAVLEAETKRIAIVETATCVLALSGKFLNQGEATLPSVGFKEGVQVVAVVRVPEAGQKQKTSDSFAPPARA